MKKLILLASLLLFVIPHAGQACDVCEKNQPAALRGITHGPGPDSNWDMVIIGAAAVIVLVTLAYSLRFLIKPDEADPGHIKNMVVEK